MAGVMIFYRAMKCVKLEFSFIILFNFLIGTHYKPFPLFIVWIWYTILSDDNKQVALLVLLILQKVGKDVSLSLLDEVSSRIIYT